MSWRAPMQGADSWPAAGGQTIVMAHGTPRNGFPPLAPRHVRPTLGVEGVVDSVVGLRSLTADQQYGLGVGVVDERVANARTRWESSEVVFGHWVEHAVDRRRPVPRGRKQTPLRALSAWGKDVRVPGGRRST